LRAGCCLPLVTVTVGDVGNLPTDDDFGHFCNLR
jgi:hypothetical protein